MVNLGPGPAWSGSLLYHVTPHWGFGAEAVFSNTGGRTSVFSDGSAIKEYSDTQQFYFATARYLLWPERSWYPYIRGSAGVGIYSRSFQAIAAPTCVGCPQSTGIVSHATVPAASFAVGLEGSPHPHADVGAELGILYAGGRNAPPPDILSTSAALTFKQACLPYIAGKIGFDAGGTGRP